MLILIIGVLALSLILVYRHYRIQRGGMAQLARSLKERKPYLSEDDSLHRVHGDWESLRQAGNELIEEFNRLNRDQSNQLTQLEAALGSLQEAVLVIDRDNYILLANKALQNMFSASKSILDSRVESVLHSAVFLDTLKAVRAGETVAQVEIEFHESQRSIWVEATGTQISDLDEPNGPWTLFVFHDVTRLKRLEAVRKEFVANVSHELKTPLSVIKGYVETLVDDHETLALADRSRFLEVVQRNCERLNLILEDLLELSRLESRQLRIQKVIKDLREWLEGMGPELEARVRQTGHQLQLEVPDAALNVEVDPFRINQIIENLVDNAQKYTPEGTMITLGAARAGDQVEFWVADVGPGIGADDLPRIFERFYRVDKGRSRERGGTGLGLSIVKHITESHGGLVRAESEEGKGTRIVVSLPAVG